MSVTKTARLGIVTSWRLLTSRRLLPSVSCVQRRPRMQEREPREYGRHDPIAPRRLELERAWHRPANPRRHRAPDHRARPVQARLDGFVAEPETFSGLAGAEALDVTQHEHGAIGI